MPDADQLIELLDLSQYQLVLEPDEFQAYEDAQQGELLTLEPEIEAMAGELDGGLKVSFDEELLGPLLEAATALNEIPADEGAGELADAEVAADEVDQSIVDAFAEIPPEAWQPLPELVVPPRDSGFEPTEIPPDQLPEPIPPAPEAGPTVSLTNLTRPADSRFYVGDRWRLEVWGRPLSPVRASLWHDGDPAGVLELGFTDASGHWVLDGEAWPGQVGHWIEVFEVFSIVALPILEFDIAALQASADPFMPEGPPPLPGPLPPLPGPSPGPSGPPPPLPAPTDPPPRVASGTLSVTSTGMVRWFSINTSQVTLVVFDGVVLRDRLALLPSGELQLPTFEFGHTYTLQLWDSSSGEMRAPLAAASVFVAPFEPGPVPLSGFIQRDGPCFIWHVYGAPNGELMVQVNQEDWVLVGRGKDGDVCMNPPLWFTGTSWYIDRGEPVPTYIPTRQERFLRIALELYALDEAGNRIGLAWHGLEEGMSPDLIGGE